MERTKIFLIGDSTVQTYKITDAPQCGWGQELYKYFDSRNVCIRPSEKSSFDNCVTYETPEIIIDNRAMAGRSLKSFFDEGRWNEAFSSIKSGDYCLIQSAHNDAYKEKEERFLSPLDYKNKLKNDYIDPITVKGAIPVLITAIAMKDFDESGKCRISFPEYREKMLELSKEYGIKLIDLGKLTADYNTAIGKEACRGIYMNLDKGVYENAPEGKEDNAHLKFEGAFIYAGFVARELKKLM